MMKEHQAILLVIERLEKTVDSMSAVTTQQSGQITKLLATIEKVVEPEIRRLREEQEKAAQRIGSRLEELETSKIRSDTRWNIGVAVMGAVWVLLAAMIKEIATRFWFGS